MMHIDNASVAFRDPARATQTLSTLYEAYLNSGAHHPLEDFGRSLHARLRQSPDPDLALTNLLRFSEATITKAALFNDLLRYQPLLDLLMTLFGSSLYFADILVRDPGVFRWLTTTDALNRPVSSDGLEQETGRVESTFRDAARKLDALRRVYRREMIRIGAMDLLGTSSLAVTTRQLSLLAESLIQSVTRIASGELSERYGASPDVPFAVIGLGKLGGCELNYSSDIDLLFIYGEDGTRTRPDGKSFTLEEYFNRLGERIIGHLTEQSQEGHLYRVDMRLRPEAGAGPLSRSVQSYLLYYEARGELWERQMLIKARPVAGDRVFGKAFLHRLDPFVYPRTFFYHPAEAIARIKSRIEESVRGVLNVKLMPGGIRDIEFIVQGLQLLHGGKAANLRTGNTLEALARLSRERLLSEREQQVLTDAYTLLRTIEHRLQTRLNTQTHTLPEDPALLDSLSRQLGMDGGERLKTAVMSATIGVKAIFDLVLSVSGGTERPGILAVIEGGATEETMNTVLSSHGFRDKRQALKNIRLLSSGSALIGSREVDARLRDALRDIAADLFAQVSRTPSPDMTLNNLGTFVSGQRFPRQVFGLLKEPNFRRFILDLCAVSPRFARSLSLNPLLVETLATNSGALATPELHPLSSGQTPILLKSHRELLAGIRHILGFSTLADLTQELAATADVILSMILRDECRKASLRRASLAVFALGKYGSCEMSFDADLDLLFFSSARTPQRRASMERLAADVVRRASAVSGEGVLYTIDARLRPEGRNAPLVADAASYERYLHERASLWERQSLTRLRFVCGDSGLARRVHRTVTTFVYDSPLPAGWVDSIVAMRRKMETRSRAGGKEFIDIKLGPGGMVDIEFAVQMIQLQEGKQRQDLRSGTVPQLLQTAAGLVLNPEDAERLGSAYRMYRRLETLLRITIEERSFLLPEGTKLDLLARCYDRISDTELKDRVLEAMKDVRTIFIRIAERLA